MTMFDVLGAIELTASAAILVSAMALGLRVGGWARFQLAACLAGWFGVVVALAATEALSRRQGIGAAGMGLVVFLPVVVLWAALLRLPSLRADLERVPLALLVGVHAVRVLGVSFLILHARGRLPAPFAPVAGWGDILVGAFALPVAYLVTRQGPNWRTALWAWNVLGLADLIAAVTLGVLSSPGPLRMIFAEPGSGVMSTLPWLLIPGFIVPLLAVLHLSIFRRLMKGEMGIRGAGPAGTETFHTGLAGSTGGRGERATA